MGRYRMGAIEARDFERQTFTIDTECGEVEVTYGKSGYGAADQVSCRYRQEDLSAHVIEKVEGESYHHSLRAQIEALDAEAKEKREVAKIRKKVAADPEPACLLKIQRSRRRGGPSVALISEEIEDVRVRGIDQRSGKALVIREGGSKDQVSPSVLLRDLNDSERADVLAVIRAANRAASQVGETALPTLGGVLAEREIEIDLTVRLDPETMERLTEHDGREYRAKDAKHLAAMVAADLVREEYPYAVENGVLLDIREWARTDDYPHLSQDIAQYQAQYQAQQDALAAEQQVQEAFQATVEEMLFDLSILTEREKAEAQPEAPVQDKPEVGTARAPEGSGDWDD